MADRQALLDEEAAEEAREEAEADARAERLARRRQPRSSEQEDAAPSPADDTTGEEPQFSQADEADVGGDAAARTMSEEVPIYTEDSLSQPYDAENGDDADDGESAPSEEMSGAADQPASDEPAVEDSGGSEGDGGVVVVAEPEANGAASGENVVQTGAEDALEELPSRPRRHRRSYKIQEVIKRRQVILVQVVKEERGNKGAALTTYLSLAGRYTVLMPNTARGGGISRKITNPQDRKRLKAIANELEVPEGMGLIIRTAGAARTKQEIKRDFEYLLRLWESVRDLTLASSAPSLVYEEGNLIKRSIRDLYNKDVEEIVVAGEHAHHEARDFMRMLMPSHTKNVILHQEHDPLFMRYGIERQLNAMFSPYVTLRSGGYLVINQTEALVAVDVNSGKATREFSIEETALNTNLEAADEIARQLKLRDLAGLIVIDFIDMEEKRNNRAVERRLKDALRHDRARIQLGHISHFGLMEMSRQRLRSGVLEGSTSQCPHCQGTGIIRSTESVALAVLRGLEDALMGGSRASLVATTTSSVALYILNNKRNFINEMEARYGVSVTVQASDKLQGANFTIDKTNAPVQASRRPERAAVNMDWGFEGEADASLEEQPSASDAVEEAEREPREFEARPGEGEGRGRRRRRGRRGRDRDRRSNGEQGFNGHGDERHDRPRRHEAQPHEQGGNDDFQPEAEGYTDQPYVAVAEADEAPRSEHSQDERSEGREGGGRRRRRGRRGGRRGRDRSNDPNRPGHEMQAGMPSSESDGDGEGDGADDGPELIDPGERSATPGAHEPRDDSAPAHHRRPAPSAPDSVSAAEPASPGPVRPAQEESAVAPRRTPRHSATSSEPKIERVVVSPDGGISGEAEPEKAAPARRGWWQRTTGGP
jgi:ribonuclease E